jgi:hypothetical protein
MNMTPLAEPGICRTSTRPAMEMYVPLRPLKPAAQFGNPNYLDTALTGIHGGTYFPSQRSAEHHPVMAAEA